MTKEQMREYSGRMVYVRVKEGSFYGYLVVPYDGNCVHLCDPVSIYTFLIDEVKNISK